VKIPEVIALSGRGGLWRPDRTVTRQVDVVTQRGHQWAQTRANSAVINRPDGLAERDASHSEAYQRDTH